MPSDVATHLNIDVPKKYTFHSYRRLAATAVADAGATSGRIQDFFGWANATLTMEYISTSKASPIKVTQKLQDIKTRDKGCKKSSKLAQCP